jgi:hypothetical protein
LRYRRADKSSCKYCCRQKKGDRPRISQTHASPCRAGSPCSDFFFRLARSLDRPAFGAGKSKRSAPQVQSDSNFMFVGQAGGAGIQEMLTFLHAMKAMRRGQVRDCPTIKLVLASAVGEANNKNIQYGRTR